MDTKPVFHGSDIEKICEYYNLKKEDIVNFGANVNPLGLSSHVKKEIADNLDLLSSYPDRDYTALRNVIAGYCGIPADYVLPGSGSSELIALLIEVRAPKHTLVLTQNTPGSFPFPAAHRNIIISMQRMIFPWMWMICAASWTTDVTFLSSAIRIIPHHPLF